AAVDRHRLDDLAPYVYRTRDAGKTWSPIARGIPAGSFVNVVREDPERRGLLYAGTETGVFVSFDDGEHWQSLQLDLPNCSVRDIAVRHGDLVIGTHGRSFWVLDDVSPLRQLEARVAAASAWLFAPRPAVRLHPAGFQGTPEPKDEPAAENPPRGAVLDYALKAAAAGPVVIEILDARGDVARRFASDDKAEAPDLQKIQVTEDWVRAPEPPAASAGMHRFVWDLHYTAPKQLLRGRRAVSGAWAPPGRYTVRLTAAGQTLTQPLVVEKDPRIPATDADFARQFELARRIEAERARVSAALAESTALRKQAAALAEKTTGNAAAALEEFGRKLTPIAGPPVSPDEFYNLADALPTSLLRLLVSLGRLQGAVESADVAPTPDAAAGFAERSRSVEQGLAAWQGFLGEELPEVNRALAAAGLAPLRPGS
ncbi:MAG TPA: hypothetical protein VN032_07225, partial [Thermoanaerobaculia bacterium]|nr:hypothetical protein [Thermoanaerobaculia bacterium]